MLVFSQDGSYFSDKSMCAHRNGFHDEKKKKKKKTKQKKNRLNALIEACVLITINMVHVN